MLVANQSSGTIKHNGGIQPMKGPPWYGFLHCSANSYKHWRWSLTQMPFFGAMSWLCTISHLQYFSAYRYVAQHNDWLFKIISCHQQHGPYSVKSVVIRRHDQQHNRNCDAGLSPTLLADVVMAMMVNLPRREEIAGIDNQGPQKSGVALLTGLMQATAKSNSQPTVTKPDESISKPNSEKQMPKPKPIEIANSAKENTKESGTLAPKIPKPPKITPAPVQEIKLRAVQLDQQQREAAQVLALKRMHACKIGAMTDLRAKMIAHLLPQLQVECLQSPFYLDDFIQQS